MVLLGGSGRSLELLAFAAQDFLGPAGLDGGKFVIEVALLRSLIKGETVPERGIAFATLCLFVE